MKFKSQKQPSLSMVLSINFFRWSLSFATIRLRKKENIVHPIDK